MPIYLKGQYRLFQGLDRISREARARMKAAIVRTADAISDDAASLAPVDTGRLAQNFEKIPLARGLAMRVRSPAHYALAQEVGYKGRGALLKTGRTSKATGEAILRRGNLNQKLPWSRDLVSWAQRRGINPWALSRSIAKKGYKPQPFMFESLDRNKEEFLKECQAALDADALAKAARG